MTGDEQLALWVAGDSRCPNDRDECCPDFSCCQPELLADKKTRERFASATDEERAGFLGMFLGAAFSKAAETDLDAPKVHIIGTDPTEH